MPKNSIVRFYVPHTEALKKKGWNKKNSKTFYEVNKYLRTIKFILSSDISYRDQLIRYRQYGNYMGGEFFVSEKQEKDFQNALKRIKRMAYEVETMKKSI